MPRIRLARVVLLVVAAALACSAPAGAQGPASLTPNTITVTGTGEVKPAPADRTSNASIVSAVEEAKAAAIPLALADGLARATRLAQLSGLKLGSLLAIAEDSVTPFAFYGPFGQAGTFGPDRFCGTIRTSTVVKAKSGKSKRIRRSRKGCRVPREVYGSLTMTFAASAA